MAQHPLQQARYRLQRMSQDLFAVRLLLAEEGINFDARAVDGLIERVTAQVEIAAKGRLPIQALNPTYEIRVIREDEAPVYPHTLRDALQDKPASVVLKSPHKTILASSLEPGSLLRGALYHKTRTYRVWMERSDLGDWDVGVYRVDEL